MHRDLPDAPATERLGAALAGAVRHTGDAPFVLHLSGPLGAGKTTLARGFLHGLGHTGRVRSPTFTLLEPYELQGRPVSHLDLYRLGDPGELDFLGIGDLLGPGAILLVEWPEKGGDRLPRADLALALDYASQGRRVALEAVSPPGEAILRRLAGRPS